MSVEWAADQVVMPITWTVFSPAQSQQANTWLTHSAPVGVTPRILIVARASHTWRRCVFVWKCKLSAVLFCMRSHLRHSLRFPCRLPVIKDEVCWKDLVRCCTQKPLLNIRADLFENALWACFYFVKIFYVWQSDHFLCEAFYPMLLLCGKSSSVIDVTAFSLHMQKQKFCIPCSCSGFLSHLHISWFSCGLSFSCIVPSPLSSNQTADQCLPVCVTYMLNQAELFIGLRLSADLNASYCPQALQEKLESLRRQLHSAEKKLLNKELETEERVMNLFVLFPQSLLSHCFLLHNLQLPVIVASLFFPTSPSAFCITTIMFFLIMPS